MQRIFFLLAALFITGAAYAQEQLHYIALELDSASHSRIAQFAAERLPWNGGKIIAHHMTMLHHTGLRCSPDDSDVAQKDYVLAWAIAHEGEVLTLIATEVGTSDRAFALRITDTAAPSRNQIKHITLATNPDTGGTAVDSNYITDWTALPEPIILQGRVTFYYK